MNRNNQGLSDDTRMDIMGLVLSVEEIEAIAEGKMAAVSATNETVEQRILPERNQAAVRSFDDIRC